MFLSFIIPVYNTEAYLDECLQSVLNQDIPHEDYEIICVNDGSKDGSLAILHRYARKYPNITVIDQENSGVCSARNTGLRAAKGEYVWFFDADDFIARNSLKKLSAECTSRAFDRLVIGNNHYIPDHAKMMIKNTPWQDSVVWRSLFRREFLLEHDLFFHYPELSFGEDALYMYEVKRAHPVTAELIIPIYYHRERPGSLSTELSPKTEAKRLQCNIREAEILKVYYEKQDGILPEETANRFMSFLWGALFRILMMPGDDGKPYLKELKEKGLYPYRRPKECTLAKCPEVNRNDLLGKVMDLLYINLGSRWGYHGMRLIQLLFRLKQNVRRT